jgi:DNA-directed RNA polymerase specialized sigma24 family protein
MTAPRRDREMHYWLLLTPEEQRAAIQRLARSGVSDFGISAATGIAVEQVRTLIGRRRECDGCGE